MRTRLAWLAMLACGTLTAPAAAQAVLSEADAIARLSSDSPRARAVRAAANVARAEVLAAGRWPNPRFAVDRESVSGVAETLITVVQPLPLSGRRGLEQASAGTLAESAVFRADAAARRLRADFRLAYAALAAAQVRERELADAGARLAELVRILERREAAGDAAGFDRLRVEREALDVAVDRELAAADRAEAQARLAAFLAPGIDPATLIADDRPTPAPDVPPLTVLVDQGRRVRAEGLALQKDIEAAQLAGRAADRRWIPEPEVIAGTKSSSLGSGDTGGVVGVQVTLPLFDHGRPERAIADARASRAAAELDALRTEVAAGIAAARASAVERRRAADRYRASALRASDEVVRIAQVSYDAGERGILELLDAYRTSALARVRQSALDAAARAAEIELEFASGWELP